MHPRGVRRAPGKRCCFAWVSTVALLALIPSAGAAGEYALIRWTVDGGGGFPLEAGRYRLGATLGQPDAGSLAGGAFDLAGGFWGSSAPAVVGVADTSGGGPGSPPVDPSPEAPRLRVLAPAPNPVVHRTRIDFELPDFRGVEIQIFDLDGGLVATLARDSRPPGRYTVEWDARDVSGDRVGSGIYFVRVRLGTVVQSHKLVVVR